MMAASPVPAVQELRALLLFSDLPAGCIACPVVAADLAPHLRPGEFAVIDTINREAVGILAPALEAPRRLLAGGGRR